MTTVESAAQNAAFMDEVTSAIGQFVTENHKKPLRPHAATAVLTHWVDALGCAIAASPSETCRIAKSLAAAQPLPAGASVIGLPSFSTPELAVFANSSMVRNLDFNDTYNSRSGGHPSVLFPGMLAVAEFSALPAEDFVHAIFIASEVYGALCDAVSLRENGWDAGAFVSVACAAGVASLLNLSAEATAHAVSL